MHSMFNSVAAHSQTQLISIVAEAGNGKSRLLYEFINWLDVQPLKVRVFKGRATRELEQKPYALIRDLFSSLFDIQDNDRAAEVREKFERGMRTVSDNAPDAVLHAHFIGHLLGFDFSNSAHLQGVIHDARQIRDDAFHYATQFFANATKNHTGVILLEDIHWASFICILFCLLVIVL